MPIRDPFKSFTQSFKTKRSITDPIASDTWTVDDPKGKPRTVRIEIGKPTELPQTANGDWFCPIFIEGFTPHVTPVMGVGPIDSLLNAVTLLRSFVETVAHMHIVPGSSRARSRRTR